MPEIKIVGVVEFDEGHEMRFQRDGQGWQPDLMVNRNEGTYGPAPECFSPVPELVAELDKALKRAAEAELEMLRILEATGYCPWPGGGMD